jgi:hypothetical protein
MPRILVLADSGFGKSTSLLAIPEVGIEGLPVKETYLVTATSRPLPYRGAGKLYPVTSATNLRGGRRVITNDAKVIETVLTKLLETPIKYVVLDDFNYVMQDWYMDNALKTGWDAPKTIGANMGRVFKVIEKYEIQDKFVIILAHGENVNKPDGRIYTKLKTTGKMVDEFITPEGKFDVTLIGKSRFDPVANKVIKEYITNEDAVYSSPKSPIGMLPDLYMPNDLGKIVKKIEAYFAGEMEEEKLIEIKPEENGQNTQTNSLENLVVN